IIDIEAPEAHIEEADDEPIEQSGVYISKIYSGGDDILEFVEIYNSGSDLATNYFKIKLYKDVLDTNPTVINLGKGVFRTKSSVSVGYIENIETDEIKYDGYYTGSKNNNLIGADKYAIEIEIDDFSQLVCSSKSDKCSSPTTDKNHIIQTCLETEDKSGDCDDNEYLKIKHDNNIRYYFGGFIPDSDSESDIDPDTNQPPEIELPKNTCENLKLNEIAANVDEQFIEIINVGEGTASLNGCVIKTNIVNDKSHIFKGDIELDSGELHTINLSGSDLSIVKTTKRTVYLLSEDEETEVDSIIYENLKKDTSWSRFSGGESSEDIWRQTYTLTPGEENLYAEFPACEAGFERNLETGRCRKIIDAQIATLVECAEGQYRNLETNRCRKIESSSSTLTPCKPDQYRHPETNRCRKLESLVSASLTPCKAGQYRSPETNRCRNIQVASTPTPCKDGYERNPETNRCRKIIANTGASDSVIQDPDESTKQFTGWLAVGGVGVLAVGVIGWEWKREIYGFIKSASKKFRFRRRR
ncbi:MAG: hypothetical protein KIG14_03455, partial [Candidatus Sacchiramonaceae bacterium]|nr:hypothetical protein [Candidatus Saccharimonadaceae bacterium]